MATLIGMSDTRAIEIDPKYSAALGRSVLYFGLGDWLNLFNDVEQRRVLDPKGTGRE